MQCEFQLFVIISEFLSLPNCRNWYQSFCSWEFLAGILLSASTSECFEFASLQLPRFLAFLPLISFYYREDQGCPNLKLSMQTHGNPGLFRNWFFLWKFDWVYRRWDVFCVNHWHSNRYYTINQGTEKCRDTTLIRVLFKLEPYANIFVSSYLYRWW